MMKTKKKSILLILSMVMVLMVGSIFAYFTDKESKLNKFTIFSKIKMLKQIFLLKLTAL